MRRVARRLDRDRASGSAPQATRLRQLKFVEHSVEERGIAGVKAQFVHQDRKAAALAQQCRCVTPAPDTCCSKGSAGSRNLAGSPPPPNGSNSLFGTNYYRCF